MENFPNSITDVIDVENILSKFGGLKELKALGHPSIFYSINVPVGCRPAR